MGRNWQIDEKLEGECDKGGGTVSSVLLMAIVVLRSEAKKDLGAGGRYGTRFVGKVVMRPGGKSA